MRMNTKSKPTSSSARWSKLSTTLFSPPHVTTDDETYMEDEAQQHSGDLIFKEEDADASSNACSPPPEMEEINSVEQFEAKGHETRESSNKRKSDQVSYN